MMNIDDIILARKLGGGGGGEASGTKSISITSNGTTTHNVAAYASAEITTNVANSYSASDEDKVVQSGALVAQTSDTIDTNGTYDTTTISEVVVDVSGGGGTDIPLLEDTLTGAYRNDNVTTLRRFAFSYVTGITSIFLGGLTTIQGADAFSYCSAQTIVLPKYGMGTWGGGTYVFRDARSTKTIDLSATAMISAYTFSACTLMDTLVLRSNTLEELQSTNVFNGTKFASNGTGGTLYVPQALISSYQSETNWSTILGYTNNQIKSIESTHTDPTAPIDLTLYYADGTPISS